MAVMILKAYRFQTGQKIIANGMNNFKDASFISRWAADAVSSAKELGLISGRGNELFMPHEKVNRAESAQIISLLIDKINK
ncbi:MAG: S-layer homology domain-containing protein [Paenibacillus sp.]|nr:S-layer homology domain-containing protein [Paenibacillus sp.]